MVRMMIIKKHSQTTLIYSLISLILFTFSAAIFAWDLQHDKDEIKIYTQTIPGSNFKAFRGEAIVYSDLLNVLAHQVNLESMSEWLQDCTESELISQVSEQDFYLYQRTKAPWPVSDRDYVLHMNITQDPANYSVLMTFEASSDFSKSDSDCVQVTKLTGYWRFTPLEANKVLVEYETSADPAGQVPSWLANSFVVDQPLGTLKNLKKRVEEGRFTLPDNITFKAPLFTKE